MSPRNQVLPLSFSALKYVSNLLVNKLCDDEGVCCEAVDEYISEATSEVLQDLLKVILSVENLDASTRFTCLEMILRCDIKRLDTGLFPHSYYLKILEVIRRKGKGLHHLNLKGIWLRDYPAELAELLNELKNVRVLIIPHMPDDLVLSAALKCEHLTVLDVSGECNFTVNGLKGIRSNRLKVLSIGMYGKRKICDEDDDYNDIIGDLLKNLSNLISLKTYSYTGEALLRIYKNNRNFRTKLKYIHDTGTTYETLEAIAALCPDLESVNLNAPRENVVNNFGRLQRLNSLKTSDVDVGDLMDYLRNTGVKMQVMKVNCSRKRSIDIGEIAALTPELTSLEFYKSKLICSDLNNYFINLTNVEILYCEITDDVLKFFLLNSPFLKRVVIGNAIHMTDGDIFRLCADTEFISLEEVWFSSARHLTATTVELLMGHCPNLRVLGQLTGWDISVNDLDYLRAVILSANTDLTLLPLEIS